MRDTRASTNKTLDKRRSSQVARWVGIVAAAIVAISAVWWMPYYPLWSLT